MKKKIMIGLFLTIIMSGCSNNTDFAALTGNGMVTAAETGNISTAESMVVIPNPELSEQPSGMLTADSAGPIDFGAGRMTDLSWLGFLQPIKISGFSIGDVTGNDEAAGCLVLVVSVPGDDIQGDNYIVLLDYANKKSYKMPTIIPYASIHPTDIILADVTGDGPAEIIVSDSPNAHHTGIVFEVVRFSEDGLKSIYQRDLSMDSAADNYFDVALADDYKVKISCPAIGFSEAVLLSDSGFESSDLELGMGDDSEEYILSGEYIDDSANRCYKDGKVVKEGVRMGLLNSVTVPDQENIVELQYYVYLGKWENIASITACLEYDSAADMLILAGAGVD